MTKDFIDDLFEVVEVKKTVTKSSKESFRAKKANSFEVAGVQIEGKYTLSDETKRKISESGKGRVISEETRRKIGDAHRGKVMSEEARRKISEASKGRKVVISEETKRKIGDAMRGRVVSEETKRKIGDANRGKVISEEARRNISEAQKGRDHNRPVMTPNGKFISKGALKERLVNDGVSNAKVKIQAWFKLYPNDYYYIKKKKPE
jgi:hypothetical protein